MIMSITDKQFTSVVRDTDIGEYKKTKEYIWKSLAGMLYIPATKISDNFMMKHIINHSDDIKSVCFDLEDSIDASQKSKALKMLCSGLEFLKQYIDNAEGKTRELPYILIRLDTGNAFEAYSIIMQNSFVNHSRFLGFVLPKFCKLHETDYSEDYNKIFMDIAKRYHHNLSSKIYLVPVLEDKCFIDPFFTKKDLTDTFDSYSKTAADSFILGIRVGGNDWLKSSNLHLHSDESVWDIFDMAQGISRIVSFAKSKGLHVSAPVYNFFNADTDDSFRKIIRKHQLNGLTGITVIHPSQLRIINESYAVPFADFYKSVLLLNAHDAVFKTASDASSEMLESAVMKEPAVNILKNALIYGVFVSSDTEADFIVGTEDFSEIRYASGV